MANLVSGGIGTWCNPLIGVVHDKGVGLGTVFAGLSLFLAACVAILALNIMFLLPHDYRGPLREHP
jgi:hypothetical protein